jgi:sigma-E factor negative regulatory protein RseC
MASEGTIEHDGIVQRSDTKSVTVKISSASACSGCHAGNSCTLSQTEEKIIDVPGYYNVSPGDTVTVLMKKTMGYSAVFLGYLFPLVLVVIMLIILTSLKLPEFVAGAASVSVLIPYYLILFLFRKQISKKFTFTIKV